MRRLRDYPEPDELAQMYATPHDGSTATHQKRIHITIELARKWFDRRWEQITDLSCGAGAEIAHGLAAKRYQLGDLAPGFEFCGPLNETLTEVESGGLFILSETIEHLPDPPATLHAIAERFDVLLLSTPWVNRDEQDGNPEHVWAMDTIDVGWLLEFTGWTPSHFEVHDDRPYAYRWQIWGAVA